MRRGSDLSDEGDKEDERKEKLKEWIGKFDGGEGFNNSFFKDCAFDVLLPVVQQSSTAEEPQRLEGKFDLLYYYLV